MVVLFAISAAFFNSLAIFFTRIGLRHYSPFTAFVISLVSLLVVSVTLALFTVPLDWLTNPAVLYFIAAGFIGPFLGRMLFYTGIGRVGAAIASPLHSTKSLFATLAAVAILGESLTLPMALGILLIIVGAASISSEDGGGTIEKKWTKKDLLFPIGSSACLGIASLLRKFGLNGLPSPILGVAVQNVTVLFLLPGLFLTQRNTTRAISTEKRAWFIFGLSGLCLVASQLTLFYALNSGLVLIAVPLSSLNPLFVIILVAAFLQEAERVTGKIVLGTLFIVGGAAMLAVKSMG